MFVSRLKLFYVSPSTPRKQIVVVFHEKKCGTHPVNVRIGPPLFSSTAPNATAVRRKKAKQQWLRGSFPMEVTPLRIAVPCDGVR